jgi:hypothetical protein
MFIKAKLVSGPADSDADGTLPFSLLAAATTNATLIKAGPGQIISITAINVNAAVRYLKLYDSNRSPSAGTGTPVRRYGIPGATAGAGFILVPTLPMKFVNGIAFTMTTGVADTDATALTANDVILTIEYL